MAWPSESLSLAIDSCWAKKIPNASAFGRRGAHHLPTPTSYQYASKVAWPCLRLLLLYLWPAPRKGLLGILESLIVVIDCLLIRRCISKLRVTMYYLKQMAYRLACVHLSLREERLVLANILSQLESHCLVHICNANFCTFSRTLTSPLKLGFHTIEAYSRCGQMKLQ